MIVEDTTRFKDEPHSCSHCEEDISHSQLDSMVVYVQDDFEDNDSYPKSPMIWFYHQDCFKDVKEADERFDEDFENWCNMMEQSCGEGSMVNEIELIDKIIDQ